jgi:molecular chaperone GrpE
MGDQDNWSDNAPLEEDAPSDEELIDVVDDDLMALDAIPDETPRLLPDDLNAIHDALTTLDDQFQHLRGDFTTKIKYDESKDRVIDTLHQELTAHRDGLTFNILRPIALDLLMFYDDATCLIDDLTNNNEAEDNPLLGHFVGMAEDVESILSRYGFDIFQLPDDNFDKKRQRAQRRLTTDDPDQDLKVAQRLKCGLRYEERIVRPEVVTVYRYSAPQPDNEPSPEADD